MGWIVGAIAEIPKRQMISMRAGGKTLRHLPPSAAAAAAGAPIGDYPYRSKNAIAISEMGPATNNLPPTRGSEEVGDGTMSEVRVPCTVRGPLTRQAITANISKLLRSLNKPLLAKFPFFIGC